MLPAQGSVASVDAGVVVQELGVVGSDLAELSLALSMLVRQYTGKPVLPGLPVAHAGALYDAGEG